MKTATHLLIIFALSLAVTGCAVHYYDEETGTENLWGFGYMRMKVTPPNESLQSQVHGIKVLGIGISKTPDDFSFIAGSYQKDQIDILKEDTTLRLDWPENELFSVRVGSRPPFLKDEDGSEE